MRSGGRSSPRAGARGAGAAASVGSGHSAAAVVVAAASADSVAAAGPREAERPVAGEPFFALASVWLQKKQAGNQDTWLVPSPWLTALQRYGPWLLLAGALVLIALAIRRHR